ncbi:penicillin-binding protein 2 [Georgenia sp. 10Sc9-8]|uniref:Penicillin-binding protein 2 n=1 Tax=Georgenia halotolerans TaxID=3028317 RepID=A0ABT5TZ16_9MICO|nr:penicillin-binding protein 2 [Georgenia halotolerans]
MNGQIRRLTVVVGLMFLALMISATSVQFFQAADLNTDGRNVRTVYREYGRDRGPIVVAGDPVATSTPVDDVYGYLREYPQGPLYAHTTGWFSVAFSSMTGMERAANPVLSGTADTLLLQRLQTLVTGAQPQGGAVELTLDPAVQQAASDALGDQRGAVVALDPTTGEILALVSKPTFDPDRLATHDADAAREALAELEADPGRPLENRALAGQQYAPGSSFKVITAAAFLESGDYGPQTEVASPTQLQLPQSSQVVNNPGELPCGDGSGTATLTEALRQSCNTTFALMATDLGADAMREQAEAFGFGQDLAVPLSTSPSRYPEPASEAELAMSGFGQVGVRVTPLQMAMVAAAIANDGVQMEPYLVARVLDPDLDVVSTTDPSRLATPVSPDTAADLTEMMREVVRSGTGQNAQISGLEVAGKTGSAQSGTDGVPPHAWFIGFTEAGGQEVAVATVVEEGGNDGFAASGGTTAAPIARAVMQAAVAG